MSKTLASNRLKSLDAMRGIGLLGMIPFHMILFGSLWGGAGGGQWGLETIALPLVEFSPPLGTGIIIFFFVTGMSLTLSLARRRETQSTATMFRHVVFRYGGYLLAGIIFELLLWVVITGGTILSSGIQVLGMFVAIALGATFSGPIIGLGLGAILCFPLILKLPWKKLAIASLASASIVGLILYFVFLPQAASLPSVSILTLLFTGRFSVFKGVPILLLGAAIGNYIQNASDIPKTVLGLGAVISVAYMIIPTLLGSGMLHMVMAMWTYHHSIIFVMGTSIFLIGIFQFLETRNVNLTPLTVLGRSPLFVYYGHFILFFALMLLIGFENISSTLLFGLVGVVMATIWLLSYVYGRWRFGPPSTW